MTASRRAALPCPAEADEQRTLAGILDVAVPGQWCHVPNGELRDIITAKRLSGMGVKRGIPDVLIFRRPPAMPDRVGVAIELKRERGGSVRPEQEAAISMLRRNGWIAEVCRGVAEAITLLRRCGYLR